MDISTSNIRFMIGSRQIIAVPRRLANVHFALDQLLGDELPPLPADVPAESDGFRVSSAPLHRRDWLEARYPRYLVAGYQSYRRHYIDMAEGFEAYMAGFSGKTRSTLRRKHRKLEKAAGGALDIREYRTPEEVDEFFRHAVPLSRKTYQSRLFEAGLPEDEGHLRYSRELATHDGLRAYLLFVGSQAIGYLYLPVSDGIVSYQHLGYDPEWAPYSPGTVLQVAVLERLFAENRYRYFDFVEGEGPHKAQFGNASVEACSFFLLKPDRANRALVLALSTLNSAVSLAKRVAGGTPLDRGLHSLTKS